MLFLHIHTALGLMLTYLVNVDEMLEEVAFEEKGKLLYALLLLAYFLPKPYQWMLTKPTSPLVDF